MGAYLLTGVTIVVLVGLYVSYTMVGQAGPQKTSMANPAPTVRTTAKVANNSAKATNKTTELVGYNCTDRTNNYSMEKYEVDIQNTNLRGGKGVMGINTPQNTTMNCIAENESARAEVGENNSFLNCSEDGCTIRFFWGDGCPVCAAEKEFLDELKAEYPRIRILDYEVNEDDDNLEYFLSLCNEHDAVCDEVPVTFIGDEVFAGFKNFDGGLVRYSGKNTYVGYKNQMVASAERLYASILAAGLAGNESNNQSIFKNGLFNGSYSERLGGNISLKAGTDKKVYYEGETIRIAVELDSLVEVRKVYVKAAGVDDSIGMRQWVPIVKQGRNIVILKDSMPRCYGCAGFKPGEYDIVVWAEHGERVIKRVTLTIEVREA